MRRLIYPEPVFAKHCCMCYMVCAAFPDIIIILLPFKELQKEKEEIKITSNR